MSALLQVSKTALLAISAHSAASPIPPIFRTRNQQSSSSIRVHTLWITPMPSTRSQSSNAKTALSPLSNGPSNPIRGPATQQRRKRHCHEVSSPITDPSEEREGDHNVLPCVTPVKEQQVKGAEIDASDSHVTKKTKRKTQRKTSASPQARPNPPDGWRSIYSLVEELREDRTAPVDDNGSEALPQRDRGDKIFRFQVLIALMLSSQTKDAVVGEAIRNLQEHGLDVENISRMSAEKLNGFIRRVGFHNNKTKYIKQVADILTERYDGDIPQTAKEMMELPGVGPKMAYIAENIAFGRASGIGVDTHMHRIFNNLKWVNSKNPEQTRIQLEAWLPVELWSTVNELWVGFGQESQQFKEKLLLKALNCSRPAEALRLLKRVGLDYETVGAKYGLMDRIETVLSSDA